MAEVAEGVDVTVQPDVCMGIGDCRRMMPEVFLEGEGNTSYVKEGLDGSVETEDMLEVAFTCPTSAITVTKDGQSLL